ncbi:hypothetical protein ACFL2H_13495 [Planctomycetota bacterium]
MCRKFIFFALICLAGSLGRAQTTSWKSESSGPWLLDENWTAGIPNSGNADATFGSTPGDPDGIIVDVASPVTLGSLSFDNRIPLELSGSPIRFAGQNLVDVTSRAEDLRIGTPLLVAPDDTLTIRMLGDSYLRIDARHQDDANGTLRKTGTGELSWSRSGTGWSGEVLHELGTMNVSAPTRLGALTVMGGTLSGRGNLTVDSDIEFYDGSIAMDESAYVTATRLVKRGMSSARLTGLGQFSPVPIHVDAGILTISNSNRALGGSTGKTSVGPRFAQLLLQTNSEDKIQLNGSTGFANRGGLRTDTVLTGGIDVGEGRSIVHTDRTTQVENIGGDGTLAIYGGNFVLENDTHSFTGNLELGVPGIETGGFVLSNEAVFRSLSSVTVNSYSELVLNNKSGRQQAKVDNRIGNVPTINMRGGRLLIESDDTSVTESLGDVIVHEGFSQFDGRGRAIQLNVRSFTRNGNGVFNTDLGLNAGFEGSSTLMFGTVPEISFDMLGAWITVDRDFATYDETFGIMPLYRKVTKLDSFETADETSHLEFFGGPAPLQSDKSIASMTTSLGGGTLDLSGHRLNIASGGWISSGAGNVGNGTITAGKSGSNSELFLYSYSDRQPLEVAANIVDNENGSTAITLKGRVVLSGENRYSGATTIPEGSVLTINKSAFPGGGDLNLEGGRYHFDFASDTPVLAGQVKLSQSGNLLGGDVSGDGRADIVSLDASSYLLESGALEMDLVGDGPLRKTTHGTAP